MRSEKNADEVFNEKNHSRFYDYCYICFNIVKQWQFGIL